MQWIARHHAVLPALAVAAAAVLAGTSGGPAGPTRTKRSTAALEQEAYVWQRVPSSAVKAALTEHAGNFTRVVALTAEVRWPAGNGDPRITRVPLASDALHGAHAIGLALRLGAWHGDFARDDAARSLVTSLARERVDAAREAGLAVAELQLDFDAGESQLAGYRMWVEAVQQAVAPVPVTFTALPAWMDHTRDFAALVRTTGDYVLQVHALRRPASPSHLPALCDPDAAQRAVERAATFGVPFRVALPTYGYEVAFDGQGRFAALSAEGPEPDWPAHWQRRTLAADPAQLAALVSTWQSDHPAALHGIAWYRLPVAGDQRNWPWPTLEAVMHGAAPRPHLALVPHKRADGLVELELRNDGSAPFSGRLHATADWTGATRLAADALPPLTLRDEAPGHAAFDATTATLAPGTARTVAWLRLTTAPTTFDVSLQTH